MKISKKLLIGFSCFLFFIFCALFTLPKTENYEDLYEINAPKEVVWEKISEMENKDKVPNGMNEVKIISGKGEGMFRSISNGKHNWIETCTNWEEGKTFSFDVNMESGFPYPFKKFNYSFSIEEKSNMKVLLIINYSYQFNHQWVKWLYEKDTQRVINKSNNDLIKDWCSSLNTAYSEIL